MSKWIKVASVDVNNNPMYVDGEKVSTITSFNEGSRLYMDNGDVVLLADGARKVLNKIKANDAPE